MKYAKVQLKKAKDNAVMRFHPWIFSGAINYIDKDVKDGDIVEVFNSNNDYLATGHYQKSTIAIRIISFERCTIDYEFWRRKIINAFNLRQTLQLTNNPITNAYRLIHAEGDGIPGLILDYYNEIVVYQAHSIGVYNERFTISEVLKDIYKDKLKTVYFKAVDNLQKQLNLKDSGEFLFGNTEKIDILENGIKFSIDWVNGQKTGFFIDQRINRKLLADFAKSNNILNTFCYTGGFSLYALNSGAKLVHSVDSSKKAIDLLNENIVLNGFKNVEHASFVDDTLQYLQNAHDKYDVIILDPPAYAKHHDARHAALQAYKRLNLKALQVIKKNGILFTFSCSQTLDRQLFNSTIISASIEAKRKIRILHQLSQPADHPINAFHPEGEYLKGLVLKLD